MNRVVVDGNKLLKEIDKTLWKNNIKICNAPLSSGLSQRNLHYWKLKVREKGQKGFLILNLLTYKKLMGFGINVEGKILQHKPRKSKPKSEKTSGFRK